MALPWPRVRPGRPCPTTSATLYLTRGRHHPPHPDRRRAQGPPEKTLRLKQSLSLPEEARRIHPPDPPPGLRRILEGPGIGRARAVTATRLNLRSCQKVRPAFYAELIHKLVQEHSHLSIAGYRSTPSIDDLLHETRRLLEHNEITSQNILAPPAFGKEGHKPGCHTLDSAVEVRPSMFRRHRAQIIEQPHRH
jgi:hypothetical protein